MLLAIDDLRDFDSHLRMRSTQARARLRDMLSGHRLTLREARVHDVLMPMVGLYTPGWQALPAWSWGFVELVTNEGPVGTGEWSVAVDEPARAAVERLRATPSANLLDDEWEIPLFMAWWDLVGQTLGKPLHGSGPSSSRWASSRPRACRWPPIRGSGSPMPRAATP